MTDYSNQNDRGKIPSRSGETFGRTLILSDLHFCKLGSTVSSIAQLRPLWQDMNHVILNGDTAEMYSSTHAEKSKDMARSLLSAIHQDNVETTLLCGNHDPTLSNCDHVWFRNKEILVFHGHASFKGVAPWSWRHTYIAKAREEWIEKNGDGFDEQLASLRHASTLSAMGAFSNQCPTAPHMLLLGIPAMFNVLYAWWKFPTLTEQWVSKYAPSAKFVITGHSHHAGIWKQNGRNIINTGCFGFPSHPRAVVIDNTRIVVHKLRKKHGHYVLGGVCRSWNAL